MSLRRKPVRVLLLVFGFYALVYGMALGPRTSARRLNFWTSPVFRRAKPPPPVPPPAVPVSAIPPVPESLQSIASRLIQPGTREWRTIVVHHSAGSSGNAAVIDRIHREVNGWENGLGYHFVIGNGNGSPVGAVEVGDRWIRQIQGAHAGVKATEYNQHGIGICVVGNYEETGFPEDVYPALRDLAVWLARRYSIKPENVLPHRDVRGEPTDCPGKNFPLDRLREDVRQALEK